MPTIKERHRPEFVPKAFLIHPLGSHHYPITEGFIYSREERTKHGIYFHKAIDYETKPGAPVYASASGYAVGFYHRFLVRNPDGTVRTLEGLPIGNGFGLAVQIWHPERISKVPGGIFTQYGHLSGFAETIIPKITSPERTDIVESIEKRNAMRRQHRWPQQKLNRVLLEQKRLINSFPWINELYGYHNGKQPDERESYLWTPEELLYLHKQEVPYVTLVEQGDLIGYTGESALFWGEADYDENSIPQRLPPKLTTRRWDEPHLHFEVTYRTDGAFRPKQQIDPYDIYLTRVHYRWVEGTLFVDR